jgi:hypothetical protein
MSAIGVAMIGIIALSVNLISWKVSKMMTKIFLFIGLILVTSGTMFLIAFSVTLIAYGIADLNFLSVVWGVTSLYTVNYCVRLLIYFAKRMEGE